MIKSKQTKDGWIEVDDGIEDPYVVAWNVAKTIDEKLDVIAQKLGIAL